MVYFLKKDARSQARLIRPSTCGKLNKPEDESADRSARWARVLSELIGHALAKAALATMTKVHTLAMAIAQYEGLDRAKFA